MLQSFLFKIKDHRRKQGRRYQLGHILLFTIFAILSGATSYRKVHAFIEANYEVLDGIFDLDWKRLPAYTTGLSFKAHPPLKSKRVLGNTVTSWPTVMVRNDLLPSMGKCCAAVSTISKIRRQYRF